LDSEQNSDKSTERAAAPSEARDFLQSQILRIIFNTLLKISAPMKLQEEFLHNKTELQQKSNLSFEDFERLSKLIFRYVTFVPDNKYRLHLPKALELLNGHTKDKDFVALSIHLNCKIWTYEDRLFKLGVAISTKEIADILRNNP